MKNKFCILIMLPFLLIGCGDANNENSVVGKALDNGIANSEATNEAPQVGDIIDIGQSSNIPTVQKEFTSIEDIETDIDIITMSKTLAYSQVIRMMSQPEQYWGDTVKVSGTYIKQSMEGFTDLHFLLLLDETNCCQGFLELVMPDNETLPQEGEQIAVAGEYQFFSDATGEYSAILVDDYAI